MKKNGFTLVELLAVIVILAVLALITVPILMGVLDKSKKGALKASTYGIIEAANLYYATNSNTPDIEFTCNETGCINGNEKINYKGQISGGRVKIYSDGSVSICIENNKYAAVKLVTDDDVTLSSGTCNYSGETYSVDALVSLSDYKALQNELDDFKTLVNNGKTLVADSISDAGVETSPTDSFETMATNISKLSSFQYLESNKGVVTVTGNVATYTKPAGKDVLIIFSCGSNGHLLGLNATSSAGTITSIVPDYGAVATNPTYTEIYKVSSDTESVITFSVSINGTQSFSWQYHVFVI